MQGLQQPSPPSSALFSTPLQDQCALLFMLLNNTPHPTIHRSWHTNHKMIEDMDSGLAALRKVWVEEKEKAIVFGNLRAWADMEADETTFDKRDIKGWQDLDDPSKPRLWEQWCGIVEASLRRWCSIVFGQSAP